MAWARRPPCWAGAVAGKGHGQDELKVNARAGHATAVAVHVLLGGAKLAFWQIFVGRPAGARLPHDCGARAVS
jgi:hypothetical protein